MKKYIIRPLLFFIVVLSLSGCASFVHDYKYLEGTDSKIGVVLCHGRGFSRENVIAPLRKGINQHLGYHTISIAMPNKNKNWKDYVDDFPDAYDGIEAAISYLRDEKSVTTVYLMGHSMGSRMATAFLATHKDTGIAGFIGVGIRNGGGELLDSNKNLRNVSIPVIDVFGTGGIDERHARKRADMVSARYKQVVIEGANHGFTDHTDKLIAVVVDWLKKRQQ